MEWLKRLKQVHPNLLVARAVLALGFMSVLTGLLILGLEHFHPGDRNVKNLGFSNLGAGMVMMVLYLVLESRDRQFRTDSRLHGLAEYVEGLRAYTVPRIDSIEDYLAKNGSEEEGPQPPPTVVPTESPTDRPLQTRERDTLLTIIAALAKASKIDIKAPGKSAQYIEGLTDELGAHVSKRAIEDHLKRIPDALETRMK